MRFQQIHTFYQGYLEEFYQRHSQLTTDSFQEQIAALVRDGFSGCHMFAPYMGAFGYENQLIIANNPASQSQWLKENNIRISNETNWIFEIARHQVDAYSPDILYLSDSNMFDSHFVRSLKQRPRLILGFRGASFASTTDLSEFDVIMSNSTVILQQAQEFGARNVAWFYPGLPTYFVDAVREEKKQYDVVFTGSWSSLHQYRNQLLHFLADRAATGDFNLQIFLNSDPASIPDNVARFAKPALWGMEMIRSLKRARIVFNAELDFGGSEAGNMRLFEATAVGSFVLTQHHDNMSDYFEPGIEVETFRNQDELYEKICFYLAHPEKREEIARRGQVRALCDYTIEVRAKELNKIINTLLTKSIEEQASLEKPKTVLSLKIEAQRLIDKQSYLEAFAVLIEAKALKEPLEGLDYLRALCFIKGNQVLGACEALKEELRFFPSNREAQILLIQIEKQLEPLPTLIHDAEFQNLLLIIRPYTMLSEQRLYSLYRLARHICENNIPGNFVECGVAAGGSSALLTYVIKHYSRLPRRLFSCDSFSGMPTPTEQDTVQGVDAESTGWGTGTCAAPEESVRDACAKVGAAELLTTVKGYFEDTLPGIRNRAGMISLLHLDGDWYESTATILRNLYDHVVDDGIMQVDDYGYWDGCRKAIHEFESARGITFSINSIDGTGVWFVKPDKRSPNPAIRSDLVEDFLRDDPYSHGVECQMSPNERFQLYYTVRCVLKHENYQLTRFIEIGSHAGGSLLLIANAFKKDKTVFQGITIEPCGSPGLTKVLEHLTGDVLRIAASSHDAAEQLARICSEEKRPLLIFVDGDHRYEAVCMDIRNYYPLLAPGGIMVFHDWLPLLDDDNREPIFLQHAGTEPGVREACGELMEELYGCVPLELPVLYPDDPTQTQAHLPIIPGITSTLRAYRKPSTETLGTVFNPDTINILAGSGALGRMRNKDGRLRPLSLFCETVNICNAECVMCPYSCQTRSKGTMSDELFKEVIRQYVEIGGGYLSLTPMVGDILLDKRLPQRLKLLQEVGGTIIPSVTSNLFALGAWDDDTVVQMLQTFRMLHVSCYGISPEEHRTITRRDYYDTFREQIRRLLRLKKESGATADISIGFRLLYEHSQEQILEFQIRELGQIIPTTGACSAYCNWGNTMKGPLPGQAHFIPANHNMSTCLFLTMAMMIYWNGAVSACACCDFDGTPDLFLGALGKNNTITDLFNSDKNRQLWRLHQEGALPGYCEHCSFHGPLHTLNAEHPLLANIYAFIGG